MMTLVMRLLRLAIMPLLMVTWSPEIMGPNYVSRGVGNSLDTGSN